MSNHIWSAQARGLIQIRGYCRLQRETLSQNSQKREDSKEHGRQTQNSEK